MSPSFLSNGPLAVIGIPQIGNISWMYEILPCGAIATKT